MRIKSSCSTLAKSMLISAVITIFSFLPVSAGVIADNSVSGNIVNTFSEFPPNSGDVSGLITQNGATYGERFDGQTLGSVNVYGDPFDTLTGTPTSPLVLLANPDLISNIGVGFWSSVIGNVIQGDRIGQFGEGALSILFDDPTDVFGFNILGANPQPANPDPAMDLIKLDFFGSNGSLLASISQDSSNTFFGFKTTGGDMIKAVSMTNTDGAGLVYYDITFNGNSQVTVAEPAPLALLGLGLFVMGMVRRRRSSDFRGN